MSLPNIVGDAIQQLQADPSSGSKPSQLEVFDTVLEKLTENAKAPTESYAPPTTKPKVGFMQVLKVSLIITVVATLLLLPQVQAIVDKMFPTLVSKLGAQALLIFVVSLLLLQNSFNSST